MAISHVQWFKQIFYSVTAQINAPAFECILYWKLAHGFDIKIYMKIPTVKDAK